MEPNRPKAPGCEVCILAGGLSSRLGRDKATLRLGGKTLLARVKAVATPLGCPTRVIRRDLVPRCGPLGGVYTALKTTRAQSVLFLSCDMPFVPTSLLRRLVSALRPRTSGIVVFHDGIAGFPFLLRVQTLPLIEELLETRQFALQRLARRLKAKAVHPARREAVRMLNVNTIEDWVAARQLWRQIRGSN